MAKKKPAPATETPNAEEPKSSYIEGRFLLVYGLFALAALALWGRSFYLQIWDSARLIDQANKRSLRTESLPFSRGKILDRNGRLLSISLPMYSITMDPKVYFDQLTQRDNVRWNALAKELEINNSELTDKAKDFIKPIRFEGKRPIYHSYDPRALFNIKNDDYWQLLARVSGIDYQRLQAVRHNPNSAFLALEYEAIGFEIEKLKALSKQAKISYNDFLATLYEKYNQRFIYVSRHNEKAIANYAKSLHIAGIVIKVEPRSFYPLGEKAAQLIGYTNKEGYGRDTRVGIDRKAQDNGAGLEYSLDQFLTGEKGKRTYRKDNRGNIINVLSEKKQYDPQDVVLSIDEELQIFAYEEIKKAVEVNKAESGTAVLVDIQTGEILAMANAPSFNPNDPLRKDFASAAARNRAITDTFEPASTVKPLTVLTALHHRATYPSEEIDTRSLVVNDHTVTDVAKRDRLSLTGILQKSSNIGVAKLALRLPSIALLVDTYSKVGFGKDTGLGLGGESKGTNGDRSRWSDVERATLSYGYGLNVTPLQLARAYATLGSFGIYRPLSITKVDPPVIGERVLPEKVTREVVKMMESVADKGEGGQHAAVDGYRVAIKTGTARKLDKKGKYVKRYIAYTAGIAPASDPRYSLVVIVNDPKADDYYGGRISAPLFSKIMGYTLKAKNIKPDNL